MHILKTENTFKMVIVSRPFLNKKEQYCSKMYVELDLLIDKDTSFYNNITCTSNKMLYLRRHYGIAEETKIREIVKISITDELPPSK